MAKSSVDTHSVKKVSDLSTDSETQSKSSDFRVENIVGKEDALGFLVCFASEFLVEQTESIVAAEKYFRFVVDIID